MRKYLFFPAFENEYLIKSYRNNTNEVPKKFFDVFTFALLRNVNGNIITIT